MVDDIMGQMNLNKQTSTKQTIVFIISITIVLFIVPQVVYGQNTSSSMVDKLIEDTKQEIAQETQYRTELINRIQNSTCLSNDPVLSKMNISLTHSTEDLERLLKTCVAQGLIK